MAEGAFSAMWMNVLSLGGREGEQAKSRSSFGAHPDTIPHFLGTGFRKVTFMFQRVTHEILQPHSRQRGEPFSGCGNSSPQRR